jgi:molybdopterin synthase catalytic subunit
MSLNEVRIQAEDFDLSTEVARLRADHPKVGGVVSFVGTVRDLNEGAAVSRWSWNIIRGMTEQAISNIIDQAKARWPIFSALVIHRVGPLQPKDRVHHRLPEDGSAVLEEGRHAGRGALGRCARRRRGSGQMDGSRPI